MNHNKTHFNDYFPNIVINSDTAIILDAFCLKILDFYLL